VSFEAEISAQTVGHLIGTITAQIAEKANEVHLLLSSPGGDPAEALAAYNVLRGLAVPIVTHNVGRVASASNTIFLAGNPRYV
jgi:ATP-dependent protease ClpP protease subunit